MHSPDSPRPQSACCGIVCVCPCGAASPQHRLLPLSSMGCPEVVGSATHSPSGLSSGCFNKQALPVAETQEIINQSASSTEHATLPYQLQPRVSSCGFEQRLSQCNVYSKGNWGRQLRSSSGLGGGLETPLPDQSPDSRSVGSSLMAWTTS